MPSDRTALAPAADRLRVAIDALDGMAGQIDSESLAPSEIEELVSALRRLQRLTDAAIASWAHWPTIMLEPAAESRAKWCWRRRTPPIRAPSDGTSAGYVW